MSNAVDIEGLLGRDILSYSPRYQKRLVKAAHEHWRAAGFPYPKVSVAEALNELKNLTASDKFVNGRAHGLLSTVGLRIANACHPQIWRIKARGRSCVDVFHDDDRLTRALAKAPAFWPDRCCWNAQSMRTLMRISYKMRPSNFRPVVARQLIRSFSANGSRVLDFSAGFGGRLLGTISLDRRYVGIDPARAQIAGLRRLAELVGQYVPGKVELHEACAEDLLPALRQQSVDLVFSSPPYFDRERYSAEPNQSYIRYPELSDWIKSFLAPVMHHSFRVLRPSSVMLINLTDRSDLNLKDVAVDLCDRRLAFMGTIPYPMRTNPVGGSGLLKSEPILVFQKPPIDCERIHRTIRMFGGAAAPGARDPYGRRLVSVPLS
jgi:DNA modification methylase